MHFRSQAACWPAGLLLHCLFPILWSENRFTRTWFWHGRKMENSASIALNHFSRMAHLRELSHYWQFLLNGWFERLSYQVGGLFHPWVHSPDLQKELGVEWVAPTRSLRWTTATQLSFTAFPAALVGSWVRSGVAAIPTSSYSFSMGTLLWLHFSFLSGYWSESRIVRQSLEERMPALISEILSCGLAHAGDNCL